MLKQKWIEATARERLCVIVMSVVAVCALLIAVLVRPAWRAVQSAPATLRTLDAKVLTMRAQAAHLRAASAATSSAVTPAAASPLQSAERELKSPGAGLSVTRDAAGATVVHLNAVEGARLAAWLALPEVQRQLQRLNITRDANSGRVTGSVVLRTSQ